MTHKTFAPHILHTSPWISTEEAADYIHMHPKSLMLLARQKRITAGFDGRHWRFRKEDLDSYLLTRADKRRKNA